MDKATIIKGSSDLSKNSSPVSSPVKELNIQQNVLNDDVPLIDYESKCSKYSKFIRTLTIEPAIFFFMFAYMLGGSCTSNLIMDKGCLHYFNYTKEVCNNLSTHETEKANVEKLANNYMMYLNIFSVLAAFMMIFIAPWSEKHGRKLPMILTCMGSMVADIGIIASVLYFDSSLNFLLLCRLPVDIFGGFICFLTIVYSHAAEVTTEKNRTLKYTTVEIAFMTAMSLGGISGSMILRYYGYFYVYLLELGLHIITAMWVVFFVEETSGEEVNASWTVKKMNFFRMDSISKSWGATMRPRENNQRLMILMYLLSMCMVVLIYEMFGGLGYIYAHHIYNWDPAQYNTVTTVFMLSGFIFMMFLAPLFLKVLKFSDSMLGIFGSLSMLGKNFLLAFAKYGVYIYYIGYAAGFLAGFSSLAIRTGVSKIADKEELGLVFSFLATCEALFPIIGTIISTKVFNATIDIFPSVVYLMSDIFLIIPLATFIWIYIRSKRGQYLSINNNHS